MTPAATQDRGIWVRAMPALFVVLWSSGFIGAKYGLPSAPPGTFLALRFAFVVALLLPIIWLMRAPWPASREQAMHLAVTGILVQGGYLSGVFFSIDAGMSAGLSALICGLQPALTAAGAPLLGERVTSRQWLGIALGLGGTALVVANKVTVLGLSVPAILLSVLALLSMTAGTLYQKRFCGNFDLRTGAAIQFGAAFVVMLPFALVETRPLVWSVEFASALAWLVVVLSIGAISLLALLIRRGAATKVASLFYLVPPVTALMAFAMFGERFTGLAMIGMAMSVLGVALVVRQ